MPCRQTTYTQPSDFDELKACLAKRENPDQVVEDRVKAIISDVRTRKDEALLDYTRRFDCPEFDEAQLAVPPSAFEDALNAIGKEEVAILREAAHNITEFHQSQREKSWFVTRDDGAVLGQIVRPVDAVGLYVPGGIGGETPLVSSMLMNALPAVVAGVPRIVAVSPPRKDGTLNPYILAAAAIVGITELYATGSAWAVAALAYGTDTIKPVDVIAGPGNIYVTTAKRLLVGTIGIDMIAGPSEIAILADETANPDWLAADMLSQAEHDPLAASIAVVADSNVATALRERLKARLEQLPRAEIAAKSLEDYGQIIVVDCVEKGIEAINLLAAEHLELCVADPWALVPKIRHAGAIFMGHACPEPVGDYFAGPNHVLPTMGTARFSSALSVQNFCKKSSLVSTSADYVQKHGQKIAKLARLEGLEAHARSVESRLGRNQGE